MYKAAAMRAHAGELVEQGILTKEEACGMIENQSVDVLNIWDFYLMQAGKRQGKEPLCRSPLEVGLQAYRSAVELCKSSSAFMQDASLIQAFLYNQVINGELPGKVFCLLPVPGDGRYRELQVNKRYFAHHYPNLVPEDCKQVQADFYSELRYIVDSTENATEYDVYEYMRMSVDRWRAGKSKYPAEGVDEEYMERRLQNLGEKRFYICGWDYYRLMLDYYMKRIQHYYMSEGTGDNTIQSIEALKRYFEGTVQSKSADRSLAMARHIAWYAHESYSKEPIMLAIELLEPHVEDLEEDQKPNTALYSYYIQLKAVSGDRRLVELLTDARAKMDDRDWCRLFTGPYGISYPVYYIGGEELHQEYCKTCRDKDLEYPGRD
jgi:hypothetical protein